MDDQYIEEVISVKLEDSPYGDYFQEAPAPQLVISEQPASSVRFRYPSEGNSHGGIPGVKSTEFRKTCPTVEIIGYKGYVKIDVQLVTEDDPPKMHVHSLVGKQCMNGVCTVYCGPGEMRSQFPNLGVQHVKKKDAEEKLFQQYLSQHQSASGEEQKRLRKRAKQEVDQMNLSAVRLMFVAYLPDENNEYSQMLAPVFSNVILDNKSTLKICRISRVDSPATGGAEVFLLCDKVQKDDIQVRMFEVDAANHLVWEGYCNFAPTDVHRQYAIVMKTPAYRNENIDRPVNVMIQLRRKSDDQHSQPQVFTYTPAANRFDTDTVAPKRKRYANCNNSQTRRVPVATLGSATNNGYRPNLPRNVKPKVEQHARPIDPTLLMQRHATRASSMSPPQQSASYQNGITNINVSNASPNLFQNYGSPQMVNSNSMTNMSALSPQSAGSPLQIVQSPVQQQYTSQGSSSPGYSSAYSNPPSVGTDMNSSQGSPLMQQMSPQQQQQVLSPVSSQASVNTFSNLPTSLPCVPGMNIPKPDALQAAMQQNSVSQQVSMQQVVSQAMTNQTFAPMQNVQSHGSPSYNPTSSANLHFGSFTQQETDREAFGANCENVLEQLDIDNADGKVPSLGNQFVTSLLMDNINVFNQQPSGDHYPIIQADSSVIDDSKPSDSRVETECSEDFAGGMTDSAEDYEPAIDEVFVEELLSTVIEKVAKALRLYFKTNDSETQKSALRLLTNVHDSNGNTCFHLAALNRQDNILRTLVKLGQLIKQDGKLLNVFNDAMQTPLHVAVLKKDNEAVKHLIEAGADPMIVDADGNTAIHLACAIELPDALDVMLSVAQDCNDLYNYEGLTPLHVLMCGMSEKSCRCLRILRGHELDVDEPELKSGRTALHMAIEEGNLVVATYLIAKCGADVDAQTFDGLSPLHIAAAHNKSAIIKVLLAYGADKTASYSDEPDSTAISLATGDEIKMILGQENEKGNLTAVKEQITELLGPRNSEFSCRELEKILQQYPTDIRTERRMIAEDNFHAAMENLAITADN